MAMVKLIVNRRSYMMRPFAENTPTAIMPRNPDYSEIVQPYKPASPLNQSDSKAILTCWSLCWQCGHFIMPLGYLIPAIFAPHRP